MENKDERDQGLWKIATKRAAFRGHLYSYLVINGFFWVLWYFTDDHQGLPWPIWPMLGWGIGVAFGYFDAFHGDKNSMAEQEYEKLKREQERK